VYLLTNAENINYEEASRDKKVNKSPPRTLFENCRRKLRMMNIRDLRLKDDVKNDNFQVSRKFGKNNDLEI
jgi:hypothetical protein